MRSASRYVLLTPSFALAACLALAACSGKDGANAGDTAGAAATTAGASAPASSGEGDLADVQSYRLSMDKIDKFMAAQRNLALKAKDLSPAEREAMKLRNDNADDSDESIDGIARRIESEPMMNAAIRQAGLSPREYALITMSMIQSAMAASVLKMRPNDNADSLVREMKANTDNVKFMQQNEAEIQRKQQELAAEMKRLGVELDD
jgi:cell fate (sporulation/competence/biofilm development) regulator YmcA (YheA/YmcA/DUF963 family)